MSETEHHEHHQHHQIHEHTAEQPPVQVPQPIPVQAPRNDDDVLGIIGLVCILFALFPVGLVLGLVGVSQAKKKGRSPVISRVAWIVNLCLMVLSVFVIIGIIAAISSLHINLNDTERKNALNQTAAALTAYYETNKYYPNDLSKLSVSAIQDIDSAGVFYRYTPSPRGCVNDCTSYKLELDLVRGGSYTITP